MIPDKADTAVLNQTSPYAVDRLLPVPVALLLVGIIIVEPPGAKSCTLPGMALHRTVPELISSYRRGDTTPEAVIQSCLADIADRDRGGDGLHSFVRTLDPREAISMIEAEPRGAWDQPRPLEGIPVAVKDNVDTVDLGCTAGSVLLDGVPVISDAPVVSALKAAGAIIVGKTNLSEWANFRSTRSSSGWSSFGGQTRSAVHRDRTPCGSSSGSATAVAAGFVPVAIGTETDGSIICPSATQGCVGLKPTVGRVPQTGIVPISWSQDTAGPITRTVTDAWIVQNVLERPHPEDAVPPLQPASFAGARIGVYPPGKRLHPRVAALYDRVQERLRSAGARLVQVTPQEESAAVDRADWVVMRYEFRIAIERYLSQRRPQSPWKTLTELYEENLRRASSILQLFGQETWEECLFDRALTEEAYAEARRTIEEFALDHGYNRWFESEGLDVIIAPTNGPAWLVDHVNGDSYTGTATPPAAAAGNPILSVPMGEVQGLPIGLGWYGPAGSDDLLLRFGLAWEQNGFPK